MRPVDFILVNVLNNFHRYFHDDGKMCPVAVRWMGPGDRIVLSSFLCVL